MSSCIILYLVLPFFILFSFSLRCNALQGDIDCLKSIKDSLEDPLGYLNSTWNFDNHTEGFICKFTGIVCWHADESKVLSISLPDMGLKGIYLFFFGLRGVKKIILLIKMRTKAMMIDGIEWPEREQVNIDPKILRLEKIVSRMSFMELSKATSNFSQDNEIGKGMLGKVYKALVGNGWTVAIKRLQVSEDLEEEFVSEITTLGILRHQNLVPIIGFCYERDERLLVYKYMPNGDLHEWLHSTDDKARLLDFPLRVKIAVGVAKALAWLHQDHVVHSNISTQCILLDANLDPKISNFWDAALAKPIDIGCNLSLSPMDESLDFTTYKKDVYRFGVVLLELLTRKESYQLSCLSLNFSSSSFASPLDVDTLLLGQGFDAMIMQLLELASNCMKFIPDQRPTMQEVYQTVAAIARVDDQIRDTEIQLHMD